MAPMRQLPALVSALTAAVAISAGAIGADEVATLLPVDDLPPGLCGNGRDYVIAEGDTVWFWTPPEERRGILTERDYEEVAAELGVEVAAIKAVVEIEAGKAQIGRAHV